MPKREDPFAAAVGDVATETSKDRIKRHGLDPKDTAYASHTYGPGIDPPPPLNPEYLAAQRRIEGIIHRVRSEHPDLDARGAWQEAVRQLGIDLDAIRVLA